MKMDGLGNGGLVSVDFGWCRSNIIRGCLENWILWVQYSVFMWCKRGIWCFRSDLGTRIWRFVILWSQIWVFPCFSIGSVEGNKERGYDTRQIISWWDPSGTRSETTARSESSQYKSRHGDMEIIWFRSGQR